MRSPKIVSRLIIDAAEKLFAQLGFKKTSIDDIAIAARIGKGSVYLHFPSKEAIFAAIVARESDRAFLQLSAAVECAAPGVDAVRAYVKAKLTVMAEVSSRYRLANDVIAELMPLVFAMRTNHIERERNLLTSILQEGVQAGDLVIDDIEAIVTGLTLCLDAIERAILGENEQGHTIVAKISGVLEIFLMGMKAPKR